MRSKPVGPLIAILVLALVVRVVVIAVTPDYQPIFDAADFDRHATSLADGEGYGDSQFAPGPTAFRPPAYPIALAPVQAIGGGWTAERLLGALLGVLTVLFIYLIAERLWGRRVALLAAGIAAVFPPLVYLNASLLSEVLFLPLTLAALLAALRYRQDRRLRWAAAAGALCGLVILTRTVGAPIVLALALGVWTMRPRFSRAALAAPAMVIVVALVVVSPWLVRNTIAFDRWVGLSTATGFALAGTYSAESEARADPPGEPFSPNVLATYENLFAQRSLDEAEVTSKLNDDATSFIREHPGYVAEAIAWNVLRIFDLHRDGDFEERFPVREQGLGLERLDSPVVFLGGLYAVLLLALVGVAAEAGLLRSRRAPAFVWLVPVLLVLPAIAIYGLPRYRAPVEPFLVMLASVGAIAALDRFSPQRSGGRERVGSDGPVGEGVAADRA